MMDCKGFFSRKNLIAGCAVAPIEPGNFIEYRFDSAALRDDCSGNGPLMPHQVRGQGENGNIPYDIEMVRKVAESMVRDDTPHLILQTHDYRKYNELCPDNHD
jgi:hypothetical protein